MMSVIGGTADMPGWWPDFRVWPGCMVRPCVASGFCRAGGERSRINVSGLRLELFCSRPSWISARVRSH